MAKNAIRIDLSNAVYKKVGLSRAESIALVELVLKEITDCLERGETVKLSSFGSFEVRDKGSRIGRNPKTGKKFPITPRRVIRFKPSAILRQHHANAWSDFSISAICLPSSCLTVWRVLLFRYTVGFRRLDVRRQSSPAT
jgi:integration host factor subunit alpha